MFETLETYGALIAKRSPVKYEEGGKYYLHEPSSGVVTPIVGVGRGSGDTVTVFASDDEREQYIRDLQRKTDNAERQ